jgi:transcriptional activator protein UGA3
LCFHQPVVDRTLNPRIDWAFRNIPRSRRIAQEVRARNDAGQRHVHWLDVVEEYDWQLWLV